MLRLASAQPGDRASLGPVDLNREELVAIDPNGPRGVELGDDVAGKLERAIGRIVGGHAIAAAAFVDALRNVRRANALHGGDAAERVVEEVTPMTEHVGDDAAAFLFAIVPRRPLRRLPIPLEHPVPELATHAENASEESRV